jgi:hypothetical protein
LRVCQASLAEARPAEVSWSDWSRGRYRSKRVFGLYGLAEPDAGKWRLNPRYERLDG